MLKKISSDNVHTIQFSYSLQIKLVHASSLLSTLAAFRISGARQFWRVLYLLGDEQKGQKGRMGAIVFARIGLFRFLSC
ncbi:hypothetical protein [Paenibacillus phytorum]|uniref:hypothetical protein n=1 Tax=Paenibacillus phytorum TaxID=2654977 RepID=UPI0035E407C5